MPNWLTDFLGLQVNNGRMQVQNAPGGNRDPKKSVIKRVGAAYVQGQGGRTNFESPEVDFETILTAYKKDSYIRIAFDKYVEFMFKAGWDLVGKNQNAVDYIRTRLALMAEATQTPTNQFLQEVAEDLVFFGNVFIVKARQPGSYQMPGIKAQPVTGSKPIAGYFTMPVQTVRVARDANGTVLNYEQRVTGQPQQYKPEDIIHMYYKKERGRAFGSPFILAVLDDVKLLRQIEDNVIRLIYRYLFPLYQYKVGLPQPGYEAEEEEIEYLREQLRNMPLDGALVIPERHDVDIIGAEGNALDIDNYLDYFRQRVFTGLGVPPTIMGIADTSNRSTSDTLSTDFLDRIKAFQKIMCDFLNSFIVNEILREGGFDPVIKPEDGVSFVFKEIDLFSRNAMENQVVQKWINNLITIEQARMELGYDPVIDDARTFNNLVKIPQLQATAAARAQQAGTNGTNANNTQPANQYGKKPAPGKTKNSTEEEFKLEESVKAPAPKEVRLQNKDYADMLSYHWDLTKDDVIGLVKDYYINSDRKFKDFHIKEAEGIIYLTKESMRREAEKFLRPAFVKGTDDARVELDIYGIPDINFTTSQKIILQHNSYYIDSLMEDLKRLVSKAIKSAREEDAIAKVVGTFRALEYRLNFIANTEVMFAYNYGFAITGKAAKQKQVYTIVKGADAECLSRGQKPIQLDDSFATKIPPFHVNCDCILTFKKPKEVV